MTPLRIFTWNLLAPEYVRGGAGAAPATEPPWAPGHHGPGRGAMGAFPEQSPATGGERDFYRYVHSWDEWAHRRPRLLERVAAAAATADVLCLQEVSEPFLDGELRELIAARGFAFTASFREAPRRRVGVLVAHRTSAWTATPLPQLASGLEAGRVAAVELRPMRGGPRVSVVSAHLDWAADVPGRRERLDRATLGLDRRTGDTAQVLAGDVNFDPYTHPAWPHWAAQGWQTSHPQTDQPTWAADGRCDRLDAILFRGDLSLVAASAVPPLHPVPGLPSAEHPSDHWPLAADFLAE